MNYERPELLEALAAEYVLGTLRGPARRRFATLVATQPSARSALGRWERDLARLGTHLPPVTPGSQVWAQIESRLFAEPPVQPASRWRPLAMAMSLLCGVLVLGLVLQQRPAPDIGPTHVAQIMAEDAPRWVISADLTRGVLKARALNVAAAELDRVFELWMLPDTGTPQSLGLLPVGRERVERALPAGLTGLLRGAAGIAVSIEPQGGSPTGVPTGPVIHQAVLSEL